MSCNAWQEGTIKLPSAAAAGVKKAVRDAAIAYRNEVQAICKAWWADNKTSSRKVYRERLDDHVTGFYSWVRRRFPRADSQLTDDALDVLSGIISEYVGGVVEERNPRQVQEKDLDRHLGAKPTNRTTRYLVTSGGITFKGNSVHWHAEDSHACDEPNAHPITVALWKALDRVTWTRGSGGKILGNDEYNEDAGRHSPGVGGSYTVREYGYKIQQRRAAAAARRPAYRGW